MLNAVIRGQTVPGDNLSLLAFVLQEQHLLAPFSSQSRISLDVRPTRFLFDPPASNSKARCYFKTTWMIPLLVAHLLILHILFFLSFFSFFSRPIQQLSAWSSAFLLLLQKSFNPSTANAFSTADLSERKKIFYQNRNALGIWLFVAATFEIFIDFGDDNSGLYTTLVKKLKFTCSTTDRASAKASVLFRCRIVEAQNSWRKISGEGTNGSKFWRASNAINSEAAIIENGCTDRSPFFSTPTLPL